MNPIWRRAAPRSAAAMMPSHSAIECAIGFSSSTSLPLESATMACSAWKREGEAITTTRTSSRSSSSSSVAHPVASSSPAMLSAAARSASKTAARRAPGIEWAAFSACLRPIVPTPTTPTPMRSRVTPAYLPSETLCPYRIRECTEIAPRRDELGAHVCRARGNLERAVPRITLDRPHDRRGDIGDELEPRWRAVAYLDRDPSGATAIGLQVELRSAGRFGDERPTLAERVEDRCNRRTIADLDPRRWSPERIGVARAEIAPVQVMSVASTESDAPIPTTQQVLPEREGGGVELRPRSVPDLDRMKPRHAFVFPRGAAWLRVHDAPACATLSL